MAKTSLSKFNGLTAEQQKKITSAFNDPNYLKALVGSPAEQKKYGITSANTVTTVSSTQSLTAGASVGASPMAIYNVHQRYAHDLYTYFGIVAMTAVQDFYYTTGSNRVLSVEQCIASYSKNYPLGTVSEDSSMFLWGADQAKCHTNWRIDINYGVGSISGSSVQELTVNGPGIVSQVFYDN